MRDTMRRSTVCRGAFGFSKEIGVRAAGRCPFTFLTLRRGGRGGGARCRNKVDCKEFAFAPAAPETVRTGTGVGE